MASTKKKKNGSASPPLIPDPLSNVVAEQADSRVDDEPKVSFTLEFYAVDEKNTSFVGRLKKIGSEEQVSLMDGLDIQKMGDFIRHNLPKTWQHKTQPAAKDEPVELKKLAPLLELSKTASRPVEPAQHQEQVHTSAKGSIEIWQNGRQSNTLFAAQSCTVFFAVGEPQLWKQFNAHFKSLESHVPSCHFSKQNVFAEKIALELSEGQLRPGIYSLLLSAATKQPEPENPSQITADQLVQVI